jgi:adenylylsulfate kinase
MTEQKATNITWHQSSLNKPDREKLLNQKGVVIWFTGLPSSGKSTLAHAVEEELYKRGHLSYVLVSPEDREENIRRIGEVAKLFAHSGAITMTAFISPYGKDRDKARQMLEAGEFIEVFVKVSLEEAEQRDPKGLYKKARAGEIKEFTGISAPYEEPLNPELVIDTNELDVEKSKDVVIQYLEEKKIINA